MSECECECVCVCVCMCVHGCRERDGDVWVCRGIQPVTVIMECWLTKSLVVDSGEKIFNFCMRNNNS